MSDEPTANGDPTAPAPVEITIEAPTDPTYPVEVLLEEHPGPPVPGGPGTPGAPGAPGTPDPAGPEVPGTPAPDTAPVVPVSGGGQEEIA
ncbi:hypothetical protein [Streptomyces lavendofoliae]|uniref:hypothetical protein n=1 Tax=Streptomyces lavendofoliae TaxID=67314 RepID=UPI00300F01D9